MGARTPLSGVMADAVINTPEPLPSVEVEA